MDSITRQGAIYFFKQMVDHINDIQSHK